MSGVDLSVGSMSNWANFDQAGSNAATSGGSGGGDGGGANWAAAQTAGQTTMSVQTMIHFEEKPGDQSSLKSMTVGEMRKAITDHGERYDDCETKEALIERYREVRVGLILPPTPTRASAPSAPSPPCLGRALALSCANAGEPFVCTRRLL